ncbi:MAG: GNAT family N-acetyltransferase [Flavobacteriales bacterium]|nr:GNAT family N-acetyltransferase [Flavobacteriales bacterium]
MHINRHEIILENQRAILKPFNVMEIENLRTIFYNEVLEHFELVLSSNNELFNEYIDYLIKTSDYTDVITFVCFDKKVNKTVGITQLKHIDFHNKKLEVGGTWYGKEFQGTGFNKAAKQLLFNFSFESLKMRRIQFTIDVDNFVSHKSMTKLGAKQEGLLRNNWIDSQGKSRDDHYYSIIIEEWNELKNTVYKEFYL